MVDEELLEVGGEIIADEDVMEAVNKHPVFSIVGNHFEIGEGQLL